MITLGSVTTKCDYDFSSVNHQKLIDHGADLDLTDATGSSPLTLAVRHKRYVAISALLSAGCDVNVKDNEGRTALHYGSHTAVAVDSLINAGEPFDSGC